MCNVIIDERERLKNNYNVLCISPELIHIHLRKLAPSLMRSHQLLHSLIKKKVN